MKGDHQPFRQQAVRQGRRVAGYVGIAAGSVEGERHDCFPMGGMVSGTVRFAEIDRTRELSDSAVGSEIFKNRLHRIEKDRRALSPPDASDRRIAGAGRTAAPLDARRPDG
jgi:hypothetical protein